jgi:putative intracellular protease/amidase
MRARLASLEWADAIVAELHRPLTRFARAAVVTPGADHAAAYLVRNEDRSAFERALAGFVSAHPEVTVVCTGPWAPYSFAGGD